MGAMLVADIVTLLIPVWILLGLIVLLGVLALLGRIQNGRYLRPSIALINKVPILKRGMQKATNGARSSTCRRSKGSAWHPRRRTGRCAGASRRPRRTPAAASSRTGP